jgi:hypothetical protein
MGPIALSLAIASPHATVWAVDVNERALDLVRRNAQAWGSNINAALPDDVPEDVSFRTIRSNPPIRVGKNELHGLLERGSPASTSAATRGSSCSGTSVPIRCRGGWMPRSTQDSRSAGRRRHADSACSVRRHGAVRTGAVEVVDA